MMVKIEGVHHSFTKPKLSRCKFTVKGWNNRISHELGPIYAVLPY